MRTPLRFLDASTTPVLAESFEPASVVIECDGREFGWVMPTSSVGMESGPTFTTAIDEAAVWQDEDWNVVLEAVQRFLSVIAFEYDVRMESRPTSGGSGETDLLHPFGAVDVRDSFGTHVVAAPRSIIVQDDPRLRLALGLYREGLNAASPFYRFLAFWNVIDAVFAGDRVAVDQFLTLEGPSYWRPAFVKGNAAKHLRRESRNAIAHVVRTNPTDTSIDPDLPEDRERLDAEGRWIQDIARRAITSSWPRPAAFIPRGPVAGQ